MKKMKILLKPRYHYPILEAQRIKKAVEYFIKTGEGNLRIGKHAIKIRREGNRHFIIMSGLVYEGRMQKGIAMVMDDGESEKKQHAELRAIVEAWDSPFEEAMKIPEYAEAFRAWCRADHEKDARAREQRLAMHGAS